MPPLQMLTSAPLVMVAVDTHVTTPLAPTTAPVILGTGWVMRVGGVMVSITNPTPQILQAAL